ncbi:hypothetical protein AKJ51_02895, partial [candidate division MSBL1 archaeon SCGC-AAA382A20]
WVQEIPGGETLGVYWKILNKSSSLELFLSSSLKKGSTEAWESSKNLVDKSSQKGFSKIASETVGWYENYWEKVPEIEIPDKEISQLYHMGMYRLGGLCSPKAPPATLQGPWVEDHRMPPWGSDYHFNINVQECYWPVFGGNIPEFILPFFEMIESWKPILNEYAENFVGVKNGLLLPNSTDDKGRGMGGFWPGHVDHSCTAWVAQLMWLYWKYTLDDKFLKDTLYPFIDSVIKVYSAMLEEDEDGVLFLPAETSPEYNENRLNAWGRNPSIHLASIHFLASSLLDISKRLEIDNCKQKKWKNIVSKLPISSITAENEIGIWDGQTLDEPHRHFSHMAAFHPFDLLNWRNSKKDARLIENTVEKWIAQGTGLWAGWSFPWASIIYSRLGRSEAAHTMLSIFRRCFMANDYAYRYLPNKKCFTVEPGDNSIMQIEAGMASAAAVMEMCVYSSQGVLYPFAGIPPYWENVSFKDIRTEGAFLVSGKKINGVITQLTVYSEKENYLEIAIPEGEFVIQKGKKESFFEGGGVYKTVTSPKEKIKIFKRT